MHTKRILALGAAVVLSAMSGFADLAPETLSLIWTRGEASSNLTGAAFLTGSTIQFTNCQALVSGAVGTNTPAVAQDLTGLGGYLTVGNPTLTNTPLTVAITADVATNGTFYTAAFSLPTFAQLGGVAGYSASFSAQLTLTNAAGSTYTYRGLKTAVATKALGGT